MKSQILLVSFLLALGLLKTEAQQKISTVANTLESGFVNPPLPARPKALWPWVNGNFSLSQITYELEQAKQKGMGGFDIWDVASTINPDHIMPDGPAFLSDESLQGIAHAIREADRIGLEIGLVTSSSWNAGGAWVKPEHGAMGLFRSDTLVQGPARFQAKIRFPRIPEYDSDRKMLLHHDSVTGLPIYFKEVAVLAHPVATDSSIAKPTTILNLDSSVSDDFVLTWQVPAGQWRIIRYVCAPTGQPLMLPSPNSNGLMLDHFSVEAQEANMSYILNRLKSALGNLKNRSLKYLYEDSYEVNSAVWTAKFPEEFEKRNGYSLLPYLPILDGFEIGSREITQRFLFDFTKLLSNLIIENHYSKGREMSEKEGLGFYAEAGGPGKPIHNVPFEDLKALGSLTVPRGEFWNKHELLEKLQIVKGIASASHIYNQKYVEAESFTSVWLWQEGPGELKPLADRAMCEGLNRFVYHTFPHTTPEAGNPGWEYNFGTLINTTNGWWHKSSGFHEYLARCSYLLQQGNFVGDVAFYYGDEAPNFVPPKHISTTLGFGYDYDVVNTDAILNKMQVRNNKIYLPHGQSYEVLILPDEETINPKVLQKLHDMVVAGATIIGPKPKRSYGLQNYESQDKHIQSLADKLWANADGKTIKEQNVGKGKVIWGRTVREALSQRSIGPDVQLNTENKNDSIDFIHRNTPEADIYFIRNKRAESLSGTCTFRIQNKQPEWWDAETGKIIPVNHYETTTGGTTIPLSMRSHGSIFIVFRKSTSEKNEKKKITNDLNIVYTSKGLATTDAGKNPPAIELQGPWEIRFEHRTGTPVTHSMKDLASWHKSSSEGIKYFSGAAAYYNSFEIYADQIKNTHVILLALNKVKEIAEVYLNGERLGYHWHASHQFDITDKVKPGKNFLVIEVVNSINNWLVGDGKRPPEYRQARSNIAKLPNAWSQPFAEAPLIEAGLMGPVLIHWAKLLD